MTKKTAGVGKGTSGQVLTAHDAAKLAHSTLMSAAKDTTTIAYIDALSKAGRDWLRGLGMNVSFQDASITDGCRMVLWNGTPFMSVNDLGDCLALLDVYNEFDPQAVYRGLNGLIWRHPRYRFTFSLAREYSPALFIRESNYNRLDQMELAMLGAELRARVAEYVPGGDHRLWWDYR